MNYSPLLLRLPLPWVAHQNVPAYALAVDAMFIGSLAALPRARRASDAVPMLLALVSPLCVFGVERANLDLLVFAVVAGAVSCLQLRPGARLAGYAAIVAAGLVKFYPWVLLLLLLRERRRVFLGLSVAFAAVLATFFLLYRAELARIGANLPTQNPFGDAFGAAQLPTGLVLIEHALRDPLGPWGAGEAAIWMVATAALYAAALLGALRIGGDARLRRAVARLAPREAVCLAAGAMLLCGCFFAGTSVGYRAVFLLFALPGLLALARVAEAGRLSRRLRYAVAFALVLLWALPVQRLVAAAVGPFWAPSGVIPHPLGTLLLGAAVWLLREALWWWLITVLLAMVLRSVLDSRTWRQGTAHALP